MTHKALWLAPLVLIAGAALANPSSNPWAEPRLLQSKSFSDTVAEGVAAGCGKELEAVANSGLIVSPVIEVAGQPLFNVIFKNIESLGTPGQAFNLLVAEPHQWLKKAETRAELDRAWGRFAEVWNRSKSSGGRSGPGSAAHKQWREFETAVLAYHRCTVSAWYKVDYINESTDRSRAYKAAIDENLQFANAEMQKLGPLKRVLACGQNIPASVASASVRYFLSESGAAMVGYGGGVGADGSKRPVTMMKHGRWEQTGSGLRVVFDTQKSAAHDADKRTLAQFKSLTLSGAFATEAWQESAGLRDRHVILTRDANSRAASNFQAFELRCIEA
jgi:hypothetical protein